MTLTAQVMIDVVHTYVRALNAGDLPGVMALYAPDASVEDPVGSTPVSGHAAIRAFYAAATAMALRVVLEGEIRAARASCAFGFAVSFDDHGRQTTIRPIDVFDFDDAGRITRMRAYFGGTNIHS